MLGTEAKETYEELSKEDLSEIIDSLLKRGGVMPSWYDIHCSTGLSESTCKEIERVHLLICDALS
jgi:hypothetical protein